MMRADLFDLAEKIVLARGPPVTKPQLDRAKESDERLIAPFDSPAPVDINYDLQVVEGGLLRLYPDVYEGGAATLDSLKIELQSVWVDVSKLDDQTLRELLDRARDGEQFVISIADIRRGNWIAGYAAPLTDHPVGRRGAIASGAQAIRPVKR